MRRSTRAHRPIEEVVAVTEHNDEGRDVEPGEDQAAYIDQVRALEEEVLALRRRLQDAPKRVRTLEERLLETKGQRAQAVAQNEKLTYTLREARDHISALREEVDKLTQPPSAYGTLLTHNDDGTVDVYSGGRKMRVAVHPAIDVDELTRGGEVVLNESLNVVMSRTPETNGEVVTLKEILEGGERAIIIGRADEERVAELADDLIGSTLRSGDSVLMDARSGLLIEKLPRPEVEELVLEEVPGRALAVAQAIHREQRLVDLRPCGRQLVPRLLQPSRRGPGALLAARQRACQRPDTCSSFRPRRRRQSGDFDER